MTKSLWITAAVALLALTAVPNASASRFHVMHHMRNGMHRMRASMHRGHMHMHNMVHHGHM